MKKFKDLKHQDLKRPLLLFGIGLFILLIVLWGYHNTLEKSNNQLEEVDITTSENESIQEAPTEIMVYITGEVNKPGVYTFAEGVRLQEAIDTAGGFTDQADLSSLNLAKKLEDESKIVVYSKAAITDSEKEISDSVNSETININTATAEVLQTLPGIGEKIAASIVEYREENGFFSSIEELKNVNRIGDKVFESLKDKICV